MTYRLGSGTLALNEGGQLGVHDSDLRWGLHYFDVKPELDSDDDDRAFYSTCFLQAVERELIRMDHVKPEDLVEARLACVARSLESWKRTRLRLWRVPT